MQKNIIGLMLATVIPRMNPPDSAGYTSHVLGSGHVRIDVSLYEIKGFGFFGASNDQILLFQTIEHAVNRSSDCIEYRIEPFILQQSQ